MQIKIKIALTIILYSTLITGQDDIASYNPKNLCIRLVTNKTALIQWVEPSTIRSEIEGYTVYYTKDVETPLKEWTTIKIGNYPMTTIQNILLGQIYHFRIQVNALGLRGQGPLSETYDFKMQNRTRSCYDHPKTTTITSLRVLRAAATTPTTAEIWWNFAYDPHQVRGFQIFYAKTDKSFWQNKTIGLTQSAELTDLEQYESYKIALAAITAKGLQYYPQETVVRMDPEEVPLDVKASEITSDSVLLTWAPPIKLIPIKYKISFDAVKDFVDSGGIRQHFKVEKNEVLAEGLSNSFRLLNLMPYTNYRINISAVPVDYSYRPSTKIMAKTEIAAPGDMTRPELHGILNGGNVQLLLPQASEENGPVSYYYIIVVPENKDRIDAPTSFYTTEELLEKDWQEDDVDGPYITAKFSAKIPYAFILGSEDYGGFKNYKLSNKKRYRVFVRAVVITAHGYLFTDSPYSEYFGTLKEKFRV